MPERFGLLHASILNQLAVAVTRSVKFDRAAPAPQQGSTKFQHQELDASTR